jgi:hypothetical protein
MEEFYKFLWAWTIILKTWEPLVANFHHVSLWRTEMSNSFLGLLVHFSPRSIQWEIPALPVKSSFWLNVEYLLLASERIN